MDEAPKGAQSTQGLVPDNNTAPAAEINIPLETLSLSREYINLLRNWPVYKQAIIDSYWQGLSPDLGQGNSIRFTADGKRYAVQLSLHHDEKQSFVSIRRRNEEGVSESDMPGTSSEDLNPNYWQEQIRLSFDATSPHTSRLLFFRADPENFGRMERLEGEEAIPHVKAILSELQGKSSG